MSDAVTGDAVSKVPEVVPDDPATHPEAVSGGEVQAAGEDVGRTMGETAPPEEDADEG